MNLLTCATAQPIAPCQAQNQTYYVHSPAHKGDEMLRNAIKGRFHHQSLFHLLCWCVGPRLSECAGVVRLWVEQKTRNSSAGELATTLHNKNKSAAHERLQTDAAASCWSGLARDKAQTSSPAAGCYSVLIISRRFLRCSIAWLCRKINNSTMQLRHSFSWKESNWVAAAPAKKYVVEGLKAYTLNKHVTYTSFISLELIRKDSHRTFYFSFCISYIDIYIYIYWTKHPQFNLVEFNISHYIEKMFFNAIFL